MNGRFEPIDTGLTYQQAQKLFDEYIQDAGVRMHCRESEQVMRGLARHFGQDEEQWGILGLLHDIDFDRTKSDPVSHCVLARDILSEAGVSQEAIDVICSHAWGTTCGGGDVQDKKRTRHIEHVLVAAETVTGLIYATALMNPEKKLANVTVKSLKKKFKSKAFAKNCNRTFIREIENTGLDMAAFLGIALQAMQGMSDELGL
jgi:putative nucleotidyltransferase with HDIG domain